MATSLGNVLTPELTARLIALADGPAVRGIAILGSIARGEASRWSDIDVESTVVAVTDKWPTRPSFIDSRLVMSSSITDVEQRAQLGRPDKAIWAVPSFVAMRVLVDRDGALARLQEVCRSFDYAPLRPAAMSYIREKAGSSCEYVFKIRDALERRDDSKALHAAASLIGKCERIIAVAFLTPIPTENAYYRIIQQAAGPAWTDAHRSAFGLEGGDEFAQAAAACALFRETMRLVDDRLDAGTRGIVGPTLELAP
jgi:predicted nucleotidyltransferase